MPVVRALDNSDILNVRKGRSKVADPTAKAVGPVLSEMLDHPGQVRAVGTKTMDTQRWARLANQEAVENKLLDPFRKHFFEPRGHREFRIIGRQVAEG